MIELDAIDQKILSFLQTDADLSQREIAERVGLSQNACWRRIRRMKDEGAIGGYTARLDAARLGLDLTVFVLVQTSNHNEAWSRTFCREIRHIDGIVDAYRIGGDWDYLLKVVTTSMAGYDRVYQQLTSRVGLERVTGLFAMEEIFSNRPLPLAEGAARTRRRD